MSNVIDTVLEHVRDQPTAWIANALLELDKGPLSAAETLSRLACFLVIEERYPDVRVDLTPWKKDTTNWGSYVEALLATLPKED